MTMNAITTVATTNNCGGTHMVGESLGFQRSSWHVAQARRVKSEAQWCRSSREKLRAAVTSRPWRATSNLRGNIAVHRRHWGDAHTQEQRFQEKKLLSRKLKAFQDGWLLPSEKDDVKDVACATFG